MEHRKPNVYIKDVFNKSYGLLYTPTLEPDISNEEICLPWYKSYRENNSDNSKLVLDIVRNITSEVLLPILEIGVALYDKNETITYNLLSVKNESTKYLGIDIEDRNHITSWSNNAYFLRTSSYEFEKVKNHLNSLGIEKLGLIIIDGNHSVYGILKDWKYVELLESNGIVLIHDTNTHPGPIAILKAIDQKLFSIEEPLINHEDHGIAIIRKI